MISVFSAVKRSQFIFAFGVEQLVGTVVIRLRHVHLRRTIQVSGVNRDGINELLRGGGAVFFEHHHEHLGVDDRAGVEKFHSVTWQMD